MKTEIHHGYHIAGNEHVAIAISVNNPREGHWFRAVPTPNNICQTFWNAFRLAFGYAKFGLDPESNAWDRAKNWGSPSTAHHWGKNRKWALKNEAKVSKMKTEIHHEYHIAGNKYLAIAISVNDPRDARWFVNNDAWDSAKAWANSH